MKKEKLKKESRFEIIHEEYTKSAAVTSVAVILDKQTGARYLCTAGAALNTGGITPLLGKDGKPIIEPVEPAEQAVD